MSTLGTFDSFTTMRLGIYAAQQGLRVTGNNISNINTVGYTRQRADQVSFKTGRSDRYASMIDKRVGNGVLVSGINQIRDPFLDIRYRNASNDTYHLDTWLAGMQDIAAILDEVGKGENGGDGLIYKQLQDLADKLRAYGANPTIENDRLVRESANDLTKLFHSAASRLDRLYEDTKVDFNNSIDTVNEILINIRDLDKSIREAEIHGDMALELRDARNLQIDKLSQYLDIKVEYSYEDVGSGIQVEKLTIKLNNANPDESVTSDEAILVDGLYCTQLSVPEFKPLANTYDTTKYPYLKGYSYLKEYTPADAEELQAFLTENNITIDDLIPALDKDGNEIPGVYYVGTNSVEEAVPVENDNYTIQLGELVNSKGDVWKNTTTTWIAVDPAAVDGVSNASCAFTVGNTLAPNSTFGIRQADGSTKTFTVLADDATEEEIAAAGKNHVFMSQIAGDGFASFVANELTKSGRYSEFNITAQGNQLIFTAKNPGSIDKGDLGAPSDWPALTTDDPLDTNLITVSPIQILQDGSLPARTTTTDEYGNDTTVFYTSVDGQLYRLIVENEYTREIALDDNDLHGIIQAQRELLTEEGEFASQADVDIDERALTKRGIPYYIKSLDLLAQKFAEAYNELNQGYMTDKDGYYIKEDGEKLVIPDLIDPTNPGYVNSDGLTAGQKQYLINNGYCLTDDEGYAVDKNGNRITDENNDPIEVYDTDGNLKIDPKNYDKVIADLDSWLANEDNGAVFMGGPLFSNGNNGNDTTGINAHNIDISYGWSNGKWNLVPKFEKIFVDENNPDGLDHTTQNRNADHMLAMIDKALTYNPQDLYGSDAIGPELFTGSFNDMFSHMMAVEAEDAHSTTIQLSTSTTILEDLDYRREGVSGVDLNDEAMNMVQYQKAMNAAMRLMTAIDEALERLISNTGVAGR